MCSSDLALFPKGCTDGFALEIRDFAETVRGRRAKPEVDGWDGLKSMAICHAVYESALAGSPVLLSDVIEGKVRAYQAPIDEHWGL